MYKFCAEYLRCYLHTHECQTVPALHLFLLFHPSDQSIECCCVNDENSERLNMSRVLSVRFNYDTMNMIVNLVKETASCTQVFKFFHRKCVYMFN